MENRWIALAIIFASFLQFTLNWFAIVPAFGQIGASLHLGISDFGLIVGAFIAGYGILHIPGGMIASAWGMRSALLLGIFLETLGTIPSALAPNLEWLLLGRLLCGIGGSIYIGSAIGLTTAWFRDHELVTATGLITGVAFTLGAAIGLFFWGPIVLAIGWRDALLCGTAVGIVTLIGFMVFFPTPPAEGARAIAGNQLDTSSLRRVFTDRDLWLLGLAWLGIYGAYFTAAELLPGYAEKQLGVGPEAANAIGVVLLLSGIPGSFIGGWIADRMTSPVRLLISASVVISIALVLIPSLGYAGVMVAAALIGGVGILGFVAWVSMPGLYSERITVADVPTAAGLMLTIVAVGGVAVPWLYGHIVAAAGFRVGWLVLGLASFFMSLLCLGVRSPGHAGGGMVTTSSSTQRPARHA